MVKIKFHFNITPLKWRRKQLRINATEAEKILWQQIRMEKLGFKFFRQYSIEGYVIDFYCPAKRLAIEIDGVYHLRNEKYDRFRQKWLEGYNIKFLRFRNDDIEHNIKAVIQKISNVLLLDQEEKRGGVKWIS